MGYVRHSNAIRRRYEVCIKLKLIGARLYGIFNSNPLDIYQRSTTFQRKNSSATISKQKYILMRLFI